MKSPKFQYQFIGKTFFCVIFLFSSVLFLSNYSYAQQLAFPQAEGFGKFASGGRGGSVIKVTNLNDSGPGSLRQALQYSSGPRTIIFEVGGTITLNSALSVTDGDVTVAGQTAPGDGILIRGSMVIIEDSNVVLRYLRFRPGDSASNTPDGLSITAWGSSTVENIIIDHCSISWADDENFDVRSPTNGVVRNITIQNSIISECTYGALGGPRTYNKTYFKNLFAHNQERNITTNYPTVGTFDFEMINNLVYGFHGGTGLSFGSKFTILNNHYKESSEVNVYPIIIDMGSSGQGTPSETYAYISGNIIPEGTTEYATAISPYLESIPYSQSGIAPINANQIENELLSHVGSSLPNRDAVDIRLINQYNNGNGQLANSGTYPTILNGTAPIDTDNDGMPDYWENQNGLDLNNASDRNIVQPDGYTNLEYYLNNMTLNPAGITANAGEDVSICEGEEVVLTATGGATYEWSTGETTQSITVSPVETTIYTVTVFDESGSNSDQDDVAVTVNTIPEANAGEDVSVCFGNSITLTASGGSTYLWSTGETTESITVSPSETTIYSVEVFEDNCSSTDEVMVSVNELPIVDAGSNVTINVGESTTLTATGADTYLWSTGETTQSITVSPVETTTYSVTGFTNGCENTNTVTVFLQGSTVVADAGEDVSICEGEEVVLTATGGATYEWSTGETTQSITVSPIETTIYTVTVFDESGSNSDQDDVAVTVNAYPIANAGEDVSVCLGNSITLTASGGSTYLWSTGETTESITVSPSETTIYSVEVFENDCSSIDEVMVTVNEIPTVDAGPNVTINSGESTTLTAFGADTYLWSTGETTQSITVSPTETSTYSVTGFINGCENTDTVTVFLQGSNVVADAGEDVSICEGEQVVLTATGGETYEWSNGETTQSITVSPSETTTYTVTVFDESGSNSDFDDVTVTVNTLPEIDAGTDVTIYTGESITLTATGADTYLWSTGATTQSITVSPAGTTTYSVTGFTNGCEASDSVVVFVEDLVIANAGDDVSICQGYETVLTASGGDSYLWSTGATTQSITVSPNSTSTYSVIAYVGDQQDEDEVTVTVNPNPNVIIQNGDEVMILQGDYITLSATGANSYQWSNGATQPNIAVNPSVTTTYSVTGFINNCEDDKQITVSVLEEVTAVVDVEQNEICLGETVTLTASGGDEYLWSTGDTTESITVSPEESLEYSVTVFNALDFDETSVIVSVVDCSSIETPDEPEEFDFLVYQDPQTDVLKVRVSGYQSVNVNNMSIFDITGKHVFSIDFEEEDESIVVKEIDTSSFSRGIYIIRLIYDDKALVKKIPIR